MIKTHQFKWNFDYEVLFNTNTVNRDHMMIKTDTETPFGLLYVIIQKKYKRYTVYGKFANGIYFMYPKRFYHLDAVGNAVTDITISYWLKVYFKLDQLKREKLNQENFFHILACLVEDAKIKEGVTLKKIMSHVGKSSQYNKFGIIEALASVFQKEVLPSLYLWKLFVRIAWWVAEFPATNHLEPKLDLLHYKFPTYDQASFNKILLTYEDFLDTIKELSDEEVMELLGNYKVLENKDYKKDVRKMYYLAVQKRYSK